jgi:hypothetical protein
MSGVVVKAIGKGARVSDWIAVPPLVHASDPHFVRELDLKERMRVSKRFNPFFEFGDAGLFVAYRDGRPVGRISAQVNRLYRERHDPHSGRRAAGCEPMTQRRSLGRTPFRSMRNRASWSRASTSRRRC